MAVRGPSALVLLFTNRGEGRAHTHKNACVLYHSAFLIAIVFLQIIEKVFNGIDIVILF